MPDTATFNAWSFDPAFSASNSPLPAGWVSSGSAVPGSNATANVSGDPINLGGRIVEITITDADENEQIEGNSGDTLTVGGQVYQISAAYDGDRITIDGQEYRVVTLYAGNPTLAFSFPRDPETGDLMNAISGTTELTTWLQAPNVLDLPVAELPAVTCFTRGTLIQTASGEVAIEDLKTGDLVLTADRGPQAIRWFGSRRMSASDLIATPKLRPIRIRAGALGANVPRTDLLVSPQHRVLIRSAIALKMFGTNEILVAAKQLLHVDGINIADETAETEYFHMMFERHEVVFANGAATESLFTGPEALKSVGPAARAEILALFPELMSQGHESVPARTLATGRMARRLAARHVRNDKALVQ